MRSPSYSYYIPSPFLLHSLPRNPPLNNTLTHVRPFTETARALRALALLHALRVLGARVLGPHGPG